MKKNIIGGVLFAGCVFLQLSAMAPDESDGQAKRSFATITPQEEDRFVQVIATGKSETAEQADAAIRRLQEKYIDLSLGERPRLQSSSFAAARQKLQVEYANSLQAYYQNAAKEFRKHIAGMREAEEALQSMERGNGRGPATPEKLATVFRRTKALEEENQRLRTENEGYRRGGYSLEIPTQHDPDAAMRGLFQAVSALPRMELSVPRQSEVAGQTPLAASAYSTVSERGSSSAQGELRSADELFTEMNAMLKRSLEAGRLSARYIENIGYLTDDFFTQIGNVQETEEALREIRGELENQFTRAREQYIFHYVPKDFELDSRFLDGIQIPPEKKEKIKRAISMLSRKILKAFRVSGTKFFSQFQALVANKDKPIEFFMHNTSGMLPNGKTPKSEAVLDSTIKSVCEPFDDMVSTYLRYTSKERTDYFIYATQSMVLEDVVTGLLKEFDSFVANLTGILMDEETSRTIRSVMDFSKRMASLNSVGRMQAVTEKMKIDREIPEISRMIMQFLGTTEGEIAALLRPGQSLSSDEYQRAVREELSRKLNIKLRAIHGTAQSILGGLQSQLTYQNIHDIANSSLLRMLWESYENNNVMLERFNKVLAKIYPSDGESLVEKFIKVSHSQGYDVAIEVFSGLDGSGIMERFSPFLSNYLTRIGESTESKKFIPKEGVFRQHFPSLSGGTDKGDLPNLERQFNRALSAYFQDNKAIHCSLEELKQRSFVLEKTKRVIEDLFPTIAENPNAQMRESIAGAEEKFRALPLIYAETNCINGLTSVTSDPFVRLKQAMSEIVNATRLSNKIGRWALPSPAAGTLQTIPPPSSPTAIVPPPPPPPAAPLPPAAVPPPPVAVETQPPAAATAEGRSDMFAQIQQGAGGAARMKQRRREREIKDWMKKGKTREKAEAFVDAVDVEEAKGMTRNKAEEEVKGTFIWD